MTQKSDRSAKKAYREPELKVYGSVELITLSTNMTGATNDGGKGNTKTN
jgi:hypothetical protein